jgi:glutamate synthase (NADPH/NADH) small chain
VAIGNLERYTADYAMKEGISCEKGQSNGLKFAVVGSGPASLSCAADLAKAGSSVTVYEALHKKGGVLSYGIPEFRLPKALVDKEIGKVEALGVTFKTNMIVGKTIMLDELLSENDAVFIGSGAGLPMFLGITGEGLGGVSSANEFLTRVNLMKAYEETSSTPVRKGKKVCVVGAGNVAMDAARTAKRLGGDVTLVYRRGREEMPARAEEIHNAEEEGIRFELLTTPVEILGENGFVTGVKCVRMALGEPDASGRRRPVEVKGSEFVMEFDTVIVSLGTSPNPIIKQSMEALATTPKGTIITDENGLTNIPRLYAGGDAQSGAATVILAMGAGKRAAAAMLKEVGNN